jgi:hypothetical protein
VTIRWENPPTTVFVEVKYLSSLAARTVHSSGEHGYPTDQLIRNVRVGLWETGYFRPPGLFEWPVRDFAMVVLAPSVGDAAVERYRNPMDIRAALPAAERLRGLPQNPWLGESSYRDLLTVLLGNRRHTTRCEQRLIDDLVDYLDFKLRPRLPDPKTAPTVEKA